MQATVPFLGGVLLGVVMTWWVLTMARRSALRAYHADDQYAPARRAVVRHLRVHGTLNLPQVERMMDIGGPMALRFLDRMVQEGLLKQQGHRGADAFYTLK